MTVLRESLNYAWSNIAKNMTFWTKQKGDLGKSYFKLFSIKNKEGVSPSFYLVKLTLIYFYFFLLKYFSLVCAVHQTLLDTALPKRPCDKNGRGDTNLDIIH